MARLTGSIPSVSFPLPTDFFGPVCEAKDEDEDKDKYKDKDKDKYEDKDERRKKGCANVTTYHNNFMRTGWNPREEILNASNVKPATFGHIATIAVDDQVDAQSLVVGGVAYVVTEDNTIYALDFWTGSSVIHQLGAPVTEPLGCTNNGHNVGINGTPVIDLETRTIYLDAYLLDNGNPAHKIHALDIGNLAERAHSPVTVAATHALPGGGSFSFNATYQRQRPGLLLGNGVLYAGYGSFCDAGGSNSRGWPLGWDKTSLAPLVGKQLDNRLPVSGTPNFLSSIWMSGYGVAPDKEKSLYFITGNTSSPTYNSSSNISESAVKISDDLGTINSFFTPSNVNGLDSSNNDYGSGGIMVLPAVPGKFSKLAVGAGKDGRMFVFDHNNLSGFHATDIPSNVDVGPCWCGPPYFEAGAPSKKMHYVVGSGGHTVTLWSPVVTSGGTLVQTFTPVASGDLRFNTDQDGGFFTSVSSDDLDAHSALIWAVGRPEGSDLHITHYAYDGTPSGGRFRCFGPARIQQASGSATTATRIWFPR